MTDRGDVREENQDSVLCLSGQVNGVRAALFAVADGMGGLSHGAWASRLITEQLVLWWNQELPQMARAGCDKEEDIRELLDQAVWEMNRAIFSLRTEKGFRCGSTLSLLFFHGDRYQILNLGDSRVYLLRGGRLKQMTKDQSLAAQMVREKRLTEEEAEHFGKRNVLTMCVGMYEKAQGQWGAGPLMAGDTFLLCSDGLYEPLGEDAIRQILADREWTVAEKADMLCGLIPAGKARDNVSAIVAEVREER